MNFEQFRSLCQVWYLDDFWYVRFNHGGDIADTDKLWYPHLITISKSVEQPVQFVSSTGDASIWLHGGDISSPFEPAINILGQKRKVLYNGFDPNNDLITYKVNHRTGAFSSIWSDKRLKKGKHALLLMGSRDGDATIHPWTEGVITDLDDPKYIDIKKNCFSMGSAVRAYKHGIRGWFTHPDDDIRVVVAATNDSGKRANVVRRDDGYKPTLELFNGVYEQGIIHPDGTPQIVRWTGHRVLNWLDEVSIAPDRSVGGVYFRPDGPSRVVQWGIKTVITGDKSSELVYGEKYTHEWIDGTVQTPYAKIANWAKKNAVTLRQGSLGYQSAFTSELDQVAFAAARKGMS